MSQIGGKGRVIACDILDMNPIVGVDFLQGDFRDENVLNALLERVGEAKVDVVMSDMAPNFSGTEIHHCHSRFKQFIRLLNFI